ncbi:cytochrome-c peroxidase [Phenylobacterium sp.]|uniref:cytochrome-c peroxidase n=1 Tax=Phenylobacterium sp. TaxID=1871053 RepID=UPI0035AE36C1
MKLARAALAALALVCAAAAPRTIGPPPQPADNPSNPAKVELGRRLFYDADLSIDGTMSCATCHEQKNAFADGNRTHPGATGEPGRRNVMALANVGYLPSLTWGDPRVQRLEDQARIPLFGDHPVEMAMGGQDAELARRLSANACYRRLFAAAFPERGGRIATPQVVDAIAAFERTLVSFDAPVDRGRLSPQARLGQARFRAACASCHAGALFTDGAFHGIGQTAGEDQGLAEITHRPSDAYAFRTPSLRNVALTGPYLHDGSAADLQAAIAAHRMLRPSPAEADQLIAFLRALTDESFVRDPRLSLPKPDCPL